MNSIGRRRNQGMGQTFLKPMSTARSRKHLRHIIRSYFRMRPWVLLHTRLCEWIGFMIVGEGRENGKWELWIGRHPRRWPNDPWCDDDDDSEDEVGDGYGLTVERWLIDWWFVCGEQSQGIGLMMEWVTDQWRPPLPFFGWDCQVFCTIFRLFVCLVLCSLFLCVGFGWMEIPRDHAQWVFVSSPFSFPSLGQLIMMLSQRRTNDRKKENPWDGKEEHSSIPRDGERDMNGWMDGWKSWIWANGNGLLSHFRAISK